MARLSQNPGIKNLGLIGSPGYTCPVFQNPVVVTAGEPGSDEILRDIGVEIKGNPGRNNVFVAELGVKVNIAVDLCGREDNLVFLGGPSGNIKANLRIAHNSNAVIFCGSGKVGAIYTIIIRARSALFYAGLGTTCNGANVWLDGVGTSIVMGDDCMLSQGIWLRSADGHGIIDVKSRKIINKAGAILVEGHVWIGQDVIVMKGSRIGAGSVLGARSVVTRDVPRRSIAVGSPARIVKREVTWTRPTYPTKDEIQEVFDLPFVMQDDDGADPAFDNVVRMG